MAEGGKDSAYTERKKLLKESESKFLSSKDEFLKLRYGYQAVRLRYDMDDTMGCIQAYRTMVAPSGINSIIKYWAAIRPADAMIRAGQVPEAVYHLSRVFDGCPEKNRVAFNNFIHIPEEKRPAMDACFRFCKNEHEKAALITMYGCREFGYNRDFLERLYAIEPNSAFMDVLLAREICKLEDHILTSRYHGEPAYYRSPTTFKYIEDTPAVENQWRWL